MKIQSTYTYWHKFPDIFLPHFFSFAIESYINETDLHLVSVKNITFKSSYNNWFTIDILQQLRPLTANYSAMCIVTSTTIYT